MSTSDFHSLHASTKVEVMHYSTQPPGTLDVQRILKGEPAWGVPKGVMERIKKTVILADWTIRGWADSKREAGRQVITKLMRDGFNVYVWENKRVKPLTDRNLDGCFAHESALAAKISVDLLATIAQSAVSTCKLPPSRICIIDNYKLNQLITDEPADATPVVRQLFLSELCNIKTCILGDFYRIIQNSNCLPQTLICDLFSDSAISILQDLKSLIPSLTIINTPKKTLDLHYKSDNLLIKLANDQVAIEKDGIIFKYEDLAEVETLNFDLLKDPIPREVIQKLLAATPKLRHLTLRYCEFIGECNHLQPVLKDLKYLFTLCGRDIGSTRLLDIIINGTDSLEELSILGDDGSKEDDLTEKLDFKKLGFLKKLTIDCIVITPAQFAKICANTPRLKELSLEYSFKELYPGDLQGPINFKQLEFLTLVIDNRSAVDVVCPFIFSSVKNLKSINIEAEASSLGSILKGANLSQVSSLCINCLTADLNDLIDVLNRAQQLTTLTISAKQIMGKLPDCLNLHCRHLTAFELECDEAQSIDTAFLQLILTKAINLKRLSYSCSDRDLESIQTIRPSKLEKLIIIGKAVCSRAAIGNIKQALPYLLVEDQIDRYTAGTILSLFADPFHSIATTGSSHSGLGGSSSGTTSANTKVEDNFAVDADTTFRNSSFYSQQIFFPLNPGDPAPSLNHYRQRIFNQLVVSDQLSHLSSGSAFMLKNKGDLQLVMLGEHDLTKCSDGIDFREVAVDNSRYAYFEGRYTFCLTGQTWHPLPSLMAQEKLTHYKITPQQLELCFAYSKRDSLYYVRSRHPVDCLEISLNYLLQIPRLELLPQLQLPPEIEHLANYCGNFSCGSLELVKEQAYTGKQYLDFIINQKKGACRHRAVAFKALMQAKVSEVPVRILTNTIHAFVEVQLHEQWIKLDLGGYPANVSVDGKDCNQSRWQTLSHINKASPLTSNNSALSTMGLQQQLLAKAAEQMEALSEDQADTTLVAEEVDLSIKALAKQLKTWKVAQNSARTIQELCQQAVALGQRKQLLKITANKGIEAAALALQSYCQAHHHPMLYVHLPDGLVCQTTAIRRDISNQRAVIIPAPAGPLYTFLENYQNTSPAPLVVINYSSFNADDMVRFNSLLDKAAFIDGIAIAPSTKIIGLMNPNRPDCYQGEDVYSRFDAVQEVSGLEPLAFDKIAPLPITRAKAEDKCYSINLYGSSNWRERLLGQWSIDQNGLYFCPGELEKALQSQLPIEIQNGLWHLSEFQLFWRQAILRGEVDSFGVILPLPANLKLLVKQGYDWQKLRHLVSFFSANKLAPHYAVLNNSKRHEFFCRYETHPTSQVISSKAGLIAEHAGNELHVNLTGELNDGAWAELLETCQRYNVKLLVHYLTANIAPPQCLQIKAEPPTWRTIFYWNHRSPLNDHTAALISCDPDLTLSCLKGFSNKPWHVIDVSECHSGDLLLHSTGSFDLDKKLFYLKQTPRIVLNALEADEHVVLKGNFSAELIDELAPLLLARQSDPQAKGQLILLSDREIFGYLSYHYSHGIGYIDKIVELYATFNASLVVKLIDTLAAGKLSEEPIVRLKARLRHLAAFPHTATLEAAWQGMREQLPGLQQVSYDLTHSASLAAACEQKRLSQILAVLEHAPYVFITGITGVGKSTFIEEVLAKQPDIALYYGEAELLNWVKDSSPQRKILFIDEVNLSPRLWSEFEGLFEDPAEIVIQGIAYPVSAGHKIIFAGNPLAYGDERILAPFFQRHGNAVIFDPLPIEFIYERILKPVLLKTPFEADAEILARPILDIYLFLCQRSQQQVLIAPRELQMMALLTMSYIAQYGQVQVEEVARHYAYEIGKNLVPAAYQANFKQHFKPIKPLCHQLKEQLADFLATSSRIKAMRQLVELLDLRLWRQQGNRHDVHKYGGLGGLILEGEPGCGKSELVTAVVKSRGYQEGRDFYRLPVSLPTPEKAKVLLQAFHEGAIVIIDEINSAPLMERLMNALLMGKTLDNRRPQRPGFLVIGTQNPVSMEGRQPASTALARRMLTIHLEAYKKAEMVSILCHQGMPPKRAVSLARAYKRYRHKAVERRLKPIPTFRDLLRVANKDIQDCLSRDV